MKASWRTHRFAAWLASFAILLAALAPAISHAVAAVQGGASWVEVCTATGPALVKVAGEQAPAAPEQDGQGMHMEDCPFCLSHAGSFGLAPAAEAALPASLGTDPAPALFYQSPRPLFAWAAAQARAPPYPA